MRKFNKLTFVKHTVKKRSNQYSVFRCDCGNEKELSYGNVSSGRQQTCGCMIGTKTLKHGMYKTPFYNRWENMICRCTRENTQYFKDYGGRGIKVCDRWKKFLNFKEDMLESFNDFRKNNSLFDTTLDRVDVNGNYELGNCRWATRKEQSLNRRNNKICVDL